MRNILKYLLLFIVTAVFWDRADAVTSSADKDTYIVFPAEESVFHTKISASDSELSPPHHVSITNSVQVQSTARRTNGIQRNKAEFTKCGKVINSSQRYFIQKKTIITHSSLIEPAQKLLYLGKLII